MPSSWYTFLSSAVISGTEPLCHLFSAAGFRPGKRVTIEQFIAGCSRLAEEENATRERGEKLLIGKMPFKYSKILKFFFRV